MYGVCALDVARTWQGKGGLLDVSSPDIRYGYGSLITDYGLALWTWEWTMGMDKDMDGMEGKRLLLSLFSKRGLC